MNHHDIDSLLEDLSRQGAARRAVAADCADLDRRLADAVRRHRRPYELTATAIPLTLLIAAVAVSSATPATATNAVDCNRSCSPDAVIANADAVIDAWLANA